MAFPRTFYRKTNHRKTRWQLYYPGFNPTNGCWLEGGWVDVPEAEYEARKAAHQALFANVNAERATQHHNNPAVPLDAMSEAQKVAYEFRSGSVTFAVQWLNPRRVHLLAVSMEGNRPDKDAIRYLRSNEVKVFRRTLDKRSGQVTDLLDDYCFPPDFVLDNAEPLDPWEHIIQTNRHSAFELFLYYCECIRNSGAPATYGAGESFYIANVIRFLILKEDEIIRSEWGLQSGDMDPYTDLSRERGAYGEMLAKARESLGDRFDDLYAEAKSRHNDISRSCLDQVKTSQRFVLPKFNPDGTHDPWGENDVPMKVVTA